MKHLHLVHDLNAWASVATDTGYHPSEKYFCPIAGPDCPSLCTGPQTDAKPPSKVLAPRKLMGHLLLSSAPSQFHSLSTPFFWGKSFHLGTDASKITTLYHFITLLTFLCRQAFCTFYKGFTMCSYSSECFAQVGTSAAIQVPLWGYPELLFALCRGAKP